MLSRLLRAALRPGFRHVYAMRGLNCGRGWLLFNPHSACIDVLEFAGDTFAAGVFAEAEAQGVEYRVPDGKRLNDRWQV